MDISAMNGTVSYYDNNASQYFDRTSKVTFDALYEEFLKYIPARGRIMDLGCGSGRDVKWFREHGYEAFGLDASERLVQIARTRFSIPVEVGSIEEWISDEPYDGIWCCASLMHLDDMAIECFLSNLEYNLRPVGAMFISVKEGIETGVDEAGRYFRDFDEESLKTFISPYNNLNIEKVWYTEDKLNRNSFRWLNALIIHNDNSVR